VRWKIQNLLTRVEGEPDELGWLLEYLTIHDRVYRPWRRRYETVQIPLFKLPGQTFPTGFGWTTLKAAKAAGFQVVIEDLRTVPCQRDLTADLEWLRHHPGLAPGVELTHQIEAVEAVIKRRRGIIKAPTGSGKTSIAVGIAKVLPCRWLFLVHRGDLMVQTAATYRERAGLDAGMVGDGRLDVQRFTVGMFQTVYQGLKSHRPEILDLLNQAEGLMVDECHTLPANTFNTTAMATPNAYFRIGLSGTPLQRSDKRSAFVVGALGPLIYSIKAQPLIDLGVLSRPTIRLVRVRQKSEKPTWQGVYGESVIRSKRRNRALLGVIQRAAKPCLVFVQQLAHGQNLLAMLRNEGVAADFVWGEKQVSQRQAAIARLVRGEIDVLIANVIFQEGVDIPSLRSVVVGTGGASVIAALQRLGRGLRVSPGKNTVEIWDIADEDCGCMQKEDEGLGESHAGCRWLTRHTKERLRAYASEDYPHTIEDAQQILPGVG